MPVQTPQQHQEQRKPFSLPERNENNRRVFAYLNKTRGIDAEIISHCMHNKILYEDREHHNCVFVGYDDQGKEPRFASVRSSLTKGQWRMDQPGSTKDYSFRIEAHQSHQVMVFEAPIDAMSFASLMKQQGKDWKGMNYLSLSGVSEHALFHFLEAHPQVQSVTLALDGDQPGRSAALKLRELVRSHHPELRVNLVWPCAAQGKDWNDVLLFKRQEKEKGIELEENMNQAQRKAQTRNHTEVTEGESWVRREERER
jgi:hypothetical protein